MAEGSTNNIVYHIAANLPEDDYNDFLKTGYREITIFAPKFKELKKLGVEEEKAWICANMRNGNWYCGGY